MFKLKEKQPKDTLSVIDMLSLSLRVFKTRPMRTFLTILGMSFGVGVVLFLVSLGFGLQFILLGNLASTEDSLVTLDTYYPTESGLKITPEKLAEIEASAHVAEVSPISELPAELRVDDTAGILLARVINLNYFRLSGTKVDIGESLSGQLNEIIVTATALQILGLPASKDSIGKKTSLSIFYPAGDVNGGVVPHNLSSAVIRGIVTDAAEAPIVYLSAGDGLPLPPFSERVLIKADSIDNVTALRDRLTDAGFTVSARLDLINQARQILTIITIILGVFGITALVVSAIGMFNTMLIGFLERTYDVGIMKAVGARDSDIRRLFLVESLVMGFLGGVGGIAIGKGSAWLVAFGLNILAGRLGGKSVENLFVSPMWFMALIIVVASGIGILAGIVPALRAAKLSPKQAFIKR